MEQGFEIRAYINIYKAFLAKVSYSCLFGGVGVGSRGGGSKAGVAHGGIRLGLGLGLGLGSGLGLVWG